MNPYDTPSSLEIDQSLYEGQGSFNRLRSIGVRVIDAVTPSESAKDTLATASSLVIIMAASASLTAVEAASSISRRIRR